MFAGREVCSNIRLGWWASAGYRRKSVSGGEAAGAGYSAPGTICRNEAEHRAGFRGGPVPGDGWILRDAERTGAASCCRGRSRSAQVSMLLHARRPDAPAIYCSCWKPGAVSTTSPIKDHCWTCRWIPDVQSRARPQRRQWRETSHAPSGRDLRTSLHRWVVRPGWSREPSPPSTATALNHGDPSSTATGGWSLSPTSKFTGPRSAGEWAALMDGNTGRLGTI